MQLSFPTYFCRTDVCKYYVYKIKVTLDVCIVWEVSSYVYNSFILWCFSESPQRQELSSHYTEVFQNSSSPCFCKLLCFDYLAVLLYTFLEFIKI